MKSCILDGNLIWDKEMLHQELREALGFPAWYGGNLDALYDCLTDLQEETVICLAHEEELEERLVCPDVETGAHRGGCKEPTGQMGRL